MFVMIFPNLMSRCPKVWGQRKSPVLVVIGLLKLLPDSRGYSGELFHYSCVLQDHPAVEVLGVPGVEGVEEEVKFGEGVHLSG